MDEGRLRFICDFCGEEINRNSDVIFYEQETGKYFHNECRNFLEIVKNHPEKVFSALTKTHPDLMSGGAKKC